MITASPVRRPGNTSLLQGFDLSTQLDACAETHTVASSYSKLAPKYYTMPVKSNLLTENLLNY